MFSVVSIAGSFCSSVFYASISRTKVVVDYVGMCEYRGWGKERCGASRPEASCGGAGGATIGEGGAGGAVGTLLSFFVDVFCCFFVLGVHFVFLDYVIFNFFIA